MSETVQQDDSLTALASYIQQFSEAYLEAVSSTFQNMSKWARDTKMSEVDRHKAIVDEFHHLFQSEVASADRFAKAAGAAKNPGIANIMQDYATKYAEKANALLDPILDSSAKLNTALDGIAKEMSVWAERVPNFGVNGARLLGPVADGIGTIDGWIDLLKHNNPDKLRDVSVGMLTAEVLGGLAFFGVAVFATAPVAAVVGGIAAAIGAYVGQEYLGKWLKEPFEDIGAWLARYFDRDIDGPVAEQFDSAQRVLPPVILGVDPLTLDLDGDGIETLAFDPGKPIRFDHDLNGVAEGTGWISSDDGFLVLDRNGNGKIDNGSELFGDHTSLASGGFAADGFAALAPEDTNGDGLVNADDASFSSLRVWRDLNQDGVSQADELFSLTDIGIQAIHVAKTEHSQQLDNGNLIADLGSFVWNDGREGEAAVVVGELADVDFAVDTFHGSFENKIPLTSDVEGLPDMRGSGLVRSLREAASQSEEVRKLLTQFSQATTRVEQQSLVDKLLLAWADTSGLAKTLDDRNPSHFRIRYDQFGAVQRASHAAGTATSDARDVDNPDLDASYRALVASWTDRIHVLEAFNGRYFYTLPGQLQQGLSASSGLREGSINADGTQTLNITFLQQHLDFLGDAYASLRESVFSALTLQTRLADVLGQTKVVYDGNQAMVDASGVLNTIQTKIAANPAEGIGDLLVLMTSESWLGEDTNWSTASLALLENSVSQHGQKNDVQDVLAAYRVRGAGVGDGAVGNTVGGDMLVGGASADFLDGGAGDDAIIGGVGDDTLIGNDGNDTLIGGAGNDRLAGGVYGYTGNLGSQESGTANTLEGGTGADNLYGSGGSE